MVKHDTNNYIIIMYTNAMHCDDTPDDIARLVAPLPPPHRADDVQSRHSKTVSRTENETTLGPSCGLKDPKL
jgi:hypothetical protein